MHFGIAPNIARYLATMAEAIAGLAVASSVITVIDTTCKVVAIGWKCYKGLKTPPKELVEVLSELMSLKGILDTVHSHLSTLNDHSSKDFLALEVLDQTDGVLSACAAVLQDVLRIIEDLQKKKLSSVIAAATSGQKFLETKGRIERLKGILILALSCDHMYALHCFLLHFYINFVEQVQFLTADFLTSGGVDSHTGWPANHCYNPARYHTPSKSISILLSVNCSKGKKKSTVSF